MKKKDRIYIIIDIFVPVDIRISDQKNLKRKIRRMWNIISAYVAPVIVGALRSTTKDLKGSINELGVSMSTALLEKTVLLGAARISQKVLES